MSSVNPFEITKAVDFTDAEIKSTFVNYPDGGFESIAAPTSPMPKFLVGGKGGGRTHLMRFYSYALKKPREGSVISQLRSDGYLGVYFRCSGLNASRFRGKHVSDDAWEAAFNFYLDVWLTEHLLDILVDINDVDGRWSSESQLSFVRAIKTELSSMARADEGQPSHFAAEPIVVLRNAIAALRRSMDRSINNAAIRGSLDLEIASNPGQLVFTATQAAYSELPGMDGLLYTFLIDEFENLSRSQQRYVNTLIREKSLPTSFLIGSRRWGVRTHETLSAGEENKKGSEFELVELESSYRHTESAYVEFCHGLALGRLTQAGYRNFTSDAELKRFLPSKPTEYADRFGDSLALGVLGVQDPLSRKHMTRLYKKVHEATKKSTLSEDIVRVISRPSSPMSEKLSIHRFYQSWMAEGQPSLASARNSAEEIDTLRDGSATAKMSNFLNLWKNDLLAQIYMDSGRRAPYLGVERFIEMSGFLPRSFLMTMKYVIQAALVRGQSSFEPGIPVSAEAQMAGVLEASQWFLRDSRPTEGLGGECDRAVRRLATLFNRVRYSDKPTEVSCIAFSTDFHEMSDKVIQIVDLCVSHSLLIEVLEGRVTRNEGSVWHKYQLNPMLSPFYALPTARRGELQLSADEMEAIFDPSIADNRYASVIRKRLRTLTAPFSEGPHSDPAQGGLF